MGARSSTKRAATVPTWLFPIVGVPSYFFRGKTLHMTGRNIIQTRMNPESLDAFPPRAQNCFPCPFPPGRSSPGSDSFVRQPMWMISRCFVFFTQNCHTKVPPLSLYGVSPFVSGFPKQAPEHYADYDKQSREIKRLF